MEAVMRKKDCRKLKMTVVQELEITTVDCAKVDGLEKRIKHHSFVKAVKALYVCHKENNYSNRVFTEILKDTVKYKNVGQIDDTTIGNLVEWDDGVRKVCYANHPENQDREAVFAYLEEAFGAVSDFYDAMAEYFVDEYFEDNARPNEKAMQGLLSDIFESFETEREIGCEVVKKESDDESEMSAEDEDEFSE